jgi:hypothetical protein
MWAWWDDCGGMLTGAGPCRVGAVLDRSDCC